jgi:aminobenzoyl-glutamate utilization protein A
MEPFLEEQRERLTDIRRDLHRNPEVGWTEYRTTDRIARELEDLGYDLAIGRDALDSEARLGVPDPDTLASHEHRAREAGVPEDRMSRMEGGHTGLVARLDTGRPGPHVALRFDIDALPVHESAGEDHRPKALGFRSENEGVMHACGHDGHAAIGLGVVTFLRRFEDELGGRFTLLFQPSEEGSRGALAMVERGWLDDADYFLAGHLGTSLNELGAVAATTSGFLPTTKLDVSFRGRAAHAGGEPQEGRNALLAAATAALHLHAIPRHGDGETRINVGTLHAGTGRNVVPDRAAMQIETRGATEDLDAYVADEARRIIDAAAAMHGVEAAVEVVGRGLGEKCDEEWKGIVAEACEGSKYVERVVPETFIGGSEDATVMMRRVRERGGKATYMTFGSPLAAGHHNPAFDWEEDALLVAVEAMGRVVSRIAPADGGADA